MQATDELLPMSMFIDIDRWGPIPLYYQLASRIEAAILDGRIPAGARIDNEIGLGERLGISRPTERRAIQDLVDKGLLVRRRGIGTQVVHGEVSRKVELTSLFDDPAIELEMPKSASTGEPNVVMRMLDGLMSRCSRPLRCAVSRALAILTPMLSTSATEMVSER